MAKAPRDTETLDLLSWAPPKPPKPAVIEQPEGHDLALRISLEISTALREADKPRDQIAEEMSAYLGESISKGMLDAYSSQAREDHNISAYRLAALAHVLERPQLLLLLAAVVGCTVVEKRWIPAIREAQLSVEAEEIDRQRKAARRQWTLGRP